MIADACIAMIIAIESCPVSVKCSVHLLIAMLCLCRLVTTKPACSGHHPEIVTETNDEMKEEDAICDPEEDIVVHVLKQEKNKQERMLDYLVNYFGNEIIERDPMDPMWISIHLNSKLVQVNLLTQVTCIFFAMKSIMVYSKSKEIMKECKDE